MPATQAKPTIERRPRATKNLQMLSAKRVADSHRQCVGLHAARKIHPAWERVDRDQHLFRRLGILPEVRNRTDFDPSILQTHPRGGDDIQIERAVSVTAAFQYSLNVLLAIREASRDLAPLGMASSAKSYGQLGPAYGFLRSGDVRVCRVL